MNDKRKPIVSGNRVIVTRLDAEGKPTGEPINLSSIGRIEFEVEPEDDVVLYDWQPEGVTLDLTMDKVDPDVFALLMGQPIPERPKHPRLAFALYCLRRWTIDLVADGWRWAQAQWRRLPGVGR